MEVCNQSVCSDASSWSFSNQDCSLRGNCLSDTTIIASASSWSDQVSDSVVSDASDWREDDSIEVEDEHLEACYIYSTDIEHHSSIVNEEETLGTPISRQNGLEDELPLLVSQFILMKWRVNFPLQVLLAKMMVHILFLTSQHHYFIVN